MGLTFSRRHFGRLALAGLPIASVAAASGTKVVDVLRAANKSHQAATKDKAEIDSKIDGVQLGVQSWSFRDQTLDQAIKAMVKIGLGECELMQIHLEPGGLHAYMAALKGDKRMREKIRKWRLSMPLSFYHGVRKKFDKAGIWLDIYCYNFQGYYTDEEVDRGFEAAKAMGANLISSSSSINTAKRIAPFAEKHKMVVGFHNHSHIGPNSVASPESFEKILAMSKYFGANLDIGHFTAANYDSVKFILAHHNRITNLHLKDRKRNQGPAVPFGQGDAPIKQVLQLMKHKRYPFPANIEYEYDGTDLSSATRNVRECFEYCKKALA